MYVCNRGPNTLSAWRYSGEISTPGKYLRATGRATWRFCLGTGLVLSHAHAAARCGDTPPGKIRRGRCSACRWRAHRVCCRCDAAFCWEPISGKLRSDGIQRRSVQEISENTKPASLRTGIRKGMPVLYAFFQKIFARWGFGAGQRRWPEYPHKDIPGRVLFLRKKRRPRQRKNGPQVEAPACASV